MPTVEDVQVPVSAMAKRPNLKRLGRDEVSMVMRVLELMQETPIGTRFAEATRLACLLEIMKVLGYEFEDKAAAGNALSPFVEFNALRGID